MRFRSPPRSTVLIGALLLAGCGDDAPPTAPATTETVVDRDVLARLRPGVEVATINDRYGTRVLVGLPEERIFLLGLPEETTIGEILPRLERDPDLSAASPTAPLDVPEAQGRSTMAFADPSLRRSDYSDQGAVGRIRARQAWSRGRGGNVLVAVIDTGIDPTHPELRGRLAPGVDLVDGDLDPVDEADGRDTDGDGLVDEAHGHGTFVAGLVLSVAPDVRILPIRVLDADGTGSAVDVARALVIARDRGARVVNLSLGMRIDVEAVTDLVDELAERGIVFVASAGNRATDEPQHPAADRGVVGVAATDPGDRKADFSNFGTWVSVSAPGVGLVSFLPDGELGRWSGTSFATALTSGEAAVLVSAAPDVTSGEVRRIVQETATRVPDPALSGAGRIDVLAAVRALFDGAPPPPDDGDDAEGEDEEERDDEGGEVDVSVQFDGLLAAIDVTTGIAVLTDGTAVQITAETVIVSDDGLGTVAAIAAAHAAGATIRLTGEGTLTEGIVIAERVEVELESGSLSGEVTGGDDLDDLLDETTSLEDPVLR